MNEPQYLKIGDRVEVIIAGSRDNWELATVCEVNLFRDSRVLVRCDSDGHQFRVLFADIRYAPVLDRLANL